MGDNVKDYGSLIDFIVSRIDIYCNVLPLEEMASIRIRLSHVKRINNNISPSCPYPDERQRFVVREVVDDILDSFIYVHNILVVTDVRDDITLSEIADIPQIQEARAKMEARVHKYFDYVPGS